MISFRHSLLPPLVACLTLSGCAGIDEADNIEPIATGGGYQAQYRRPDVSRSDAHYLRSATINQQSCLPLRGGRHERECRQCLARRAAVAKRSDRHSRGRG